MGALPIEVEEVDHMAQHQPVKHVAERPADDQAVGDTAPALGDRLLAQPVDQQAADGERQHGEEPALPASLICREAESRSLVVDVDQVEEGVISTPGSQMAAV